MNKKFTAILNAKGIGYIHRTDSDYSSKASYAHDCRANGYKVAAILTDEEINFILNGVNAPERFGMTFDEALNKLLKYSANVVEFVREVLDDPNVKSFFGTEEAKTEQAEEPTAEPKQATAETAQKQDIKENPEIKAMLNDTYADYHGNLCTVSPEQLEKFKNLVTEIKQILSCDTEIVNGNLDSLPENKKACVNGINIERELIIIDNFYIDMMKYEGTEKVIETICHEIAHNRYWNHTKWHRQLTKEYFEKVICYLTKQNALETAETETAQVAEPIAEATEQESTYKHAVEMAKYAVKCGDGIQAIYRKGNEYKAGLVSDRTYAGSHGWKFVETVETEQAETEKSENAEISAQEHTDTKVLETPFSQTVYVDCLLNDVLAFNKAFDDLMKMRQVNERIPRPPP